MSSQWIMLQYIAYAQVSSTLGLLASIATGESHKKQRIKKKAFGIRPIGSIIILLMSPHVFSAG